MGNPTPNDWVRLEVLILQRACTLLRKHFRKWWKLTQNQEWNETPENGKTFISGPGSELYKNCGKLHKMTIEEGDTNNWDFNLLTKILQQVVAPSHSDSKVKDDPPFLSESKRINDLISYCKKAIDYPTKIMSDLGFSVLWDKIESILVSFGQNEKQLEELKRSQSVSEDDLVSISEERCQIDEKKLELAKRLKDQAKELLNRGRIEEALKSLNEGISYQKGIPDLELGALYAARSDAIMNKLGILKGKEERMELAYLALKDAKHALFLRPAWGLAHYRVGMSYAELGKYKKASKYLDQALDLEPNVEEIKVANNTCKVKLVELSQNFGSDLKTFQAEVPSSPKPLPGGTRYSPEVMDKMDILFFNEDENNILAEIYKAHKLRDGIITKQSYKEAAIIYRKAAKARNAEGLYNLALLKLEGKGVKQDVKGAIDLLKKATRQPFQIGQCNGLNYASNIGVIESSYVLGLLAFEGIGNPPQKDLFSASVYYQEASDHGHGPSAHNLGCLYNVGIGVAKNEKRALQLWKLGAARRVPESMFALAIHHAKEWETLEAKKWLELAITEYETNPEYPCALHIPEDELDNRAWHPTPTSVQQFTIILHTIDNWRTKFGQKQVSTWELNSGLKTTNHNHPLKFRLTRMLHHLEIEKDKISAIEEYFKHLQIPPVILPFPKAKEWATKVRRDMYFLGSEGESVNGSRSNSQQSARTSSESCSDESTSVPSSPSPAPAPASAPAPVMNGVHKKVVEVEAPVSASA